MFIFSLLALTAVTYACDNMVGGICVNANCQTFTGKLGTSTSSPFSGTVAFVDGTVDLIIKITYKDPNFSDAAVKGIVSGENTDSCVSLTLMKYTDSTYSFFSPTTYAITYSNDSATNRTYSFVIPSKDFVTQLKPSVNESVIGFTGYYSFQFSIGTLLQSELQFQFSAKISTTTTQSIDTTFGSISSRSDLGNATLFVQSALAFCVDDACTNTSLTPTPSLYLNDQVWLKHSLTTSGADYYIISPEIYFTGDRLFKKAEIVQSKTNTKGYSLYLITISIAWSNVSISVTGTLSSTAVRFLSEDQQRILAAAQGSTSASSSTVSCIQTSATDSSCYDCNATCTNVDNSAISGSVSPCPCSSSYILFMAYLTLLLIFMN